MWCKKPEAVIQLILLIFSFPISAQELFPLAEPASSVPKHVLGARIFYQNYDEVGTTRSLYGMRLMYGLTSKLSFYLTGTASNHHSKKLPYDLINHTHNGSQTNYYTSNIKRGVVYPYIFSGFHLFAKYRFLSFDKQNEHLRFAAYAEWSNVKVAHDEAEPNLMDDTGGYGFGIISTLLKKRFSVSLTTGYIVPNAYTESQFDLTGSIYLPTVINYGKAIKYSLSFGYRLAPAHYTSYQQSNWNIYVEFVGKKYEAAKVYQDNKFITALVPSLAKGAYLEMHPGIQRIIKSNLRFDVSLGFNIFSRSYVHFSPILNIGLQKYFYKNKKDKN